MTPIYNWTLGKFAPNLANMVRKLFQTRMVTIPKYKGISNVKVKMPVGFTQKGVPFKQGYTWQSQLGGMKYKPPVLKKQGATFLPAGSKVGPSIAGKNLKEAGKLTIAGTTGTALALAPRPSKDSTGPASVRTRQFKRVAPRKVSVATTASSGKGLRMQTKPTKVSSKVMTRPSIASYKAVPKTKVPVTKVAKTTKKVSTPVRKMASTTRFSQTMDGPKKVSRTIPIATTAASKKATAAGILTAKIIRKFGITPEQVRASDISQRKRLEKEKGGSIAGPKKATGFKSPFEGDIAKRAASGYHIFKKGSKGALSFQAAYKAAKGKKFKWKGTGKWYK